MKEELRIHRIEEGAVDRDKEHFLLHYDPNNSECEGAQLVALLGPPQEGVVLLEYLVGDGDPHVIASRNAVHREVTFYLLSKRETNPWGYAQHHCNTLANAYSDVHWSFIDPRQACST